MKDNLYMLGAIKPKKDKRDFLLAGIQTDVALPKEFEIIQQFESKNQFSRGSCTAQAQSHGKEEREGIRLSARFCFALGKEIENNNNYGAYSRTMELVNQKNGICEEEMLPEPPATMKYEDYVDVSRIPSSCYKNAEKYKSKSFWSVNPDIESIKQALYQNEMGVRIAMPWYKEFNRPIDGKLSLKDGMTYSGGHRVIIIGWTDDSFIVKNSWGNTWGVDGRCFIPFDEMKESGGKIEIWDAWMSKDMPKDQPVDNRYGRNRTWNGYLREVSMAFNPWLFKKIKRLPNNREINALAYGFWDYESVFLGKNGDLWLKITKPEAEKQNLLKDVIS